ncbi:MAG: hypothetical protein ACOVMP_08925 [Chthoniobacterales bacterium]
MKRRRRKAALTGSLDLLLDTICNAFGSIILIALLIVILAADVPTAVTEVITAPERDQIERAIANAEETVKSLQNEIDALNVKPGALEVEKLRASIKDAKSRLKAAQDSQGATGADLPIDYSATVRDSKAAQRNNNIEIAAITNAIETLANREESLKQQLAQLRSEMEKMVEARTVRFRLPKETDSNRDPFNVIFIHNEIYWFAVNGRENSQAISFRPLESGRTKLTPIRGRGDQLPSDAARVRELLSEVGQDAYVACYVFPDSVEVFRKLRELAYASGTQIGWSLETDPDALIFGEEGSRPKPQ